MKYLDEPLEGQLVFLRNSVVSPVGQLLAVERLVELNLEPTLLTQVSGKVYKIRARFDSYRTLNQTIREGAVSDGALTLAESMIIHVELVREFLQSSKLSELAAEHSSVWGPQVASLLGRIDPYLPECAEQNAKAAQQFGYQLAKLVPAPVAYYASVKLAFEYSKTIVLSRPDGIARLVREIIFPPEYQQAGLAILNYFSVVLAEKYPNIPVTISIQQTPKMVSLLVTLPDGSQETIQRALHEYGLVVSGQMSPAELLGEGISALALKQKLELAQLEVRQARDILKLQEQFSNKRIESLEYEVKNLYALLGQELTSKQKLQEGLLKLANRMVDGHGGERVTKLLNALAESVAERDAERARIVLEDIRDQSPDLMSKLSEYFLAAATSGVIGNSVYDWLKVIWPILPK